MGPAMTRALRSTVRAVAASKLSALLLVCGVAAGVRAVYYLELRGSPWLEHLFCDEFWFDGLAQQIARGQSPGGGQVYDQPPAYAYFLASLYTLLGRDLPAVRLLQLLLGVVNVGLLYIVARRACGPTRAFVSALIFAAWGPMLFFEAQLLKTVLVVFFDLLLFYFLMRCLERPGWRWGLASGLALGASAITQPIALPFLPVLVSWGWLHLRGEASAGLRRAWLRAGGALVLGVVLVVGTVTARNAIVAGRAVLISSNSGINLYLGVGPDFREKVATRPGAKWDALYSREDGEYVREVLRIVAADPLGYAANGVVKLFQFANGHEAPRCRSLYAAREESALMALLVWKRVLAFPFGLLLPFAGLGLVGALWRGRDGMRLMALFCVTHVAMLSLLFVTARFRMNVLPFLVVFAVCGAAGLAGALRARAWPAAAVQAAVLAVLLVVSNWNVGPMRREPFPDVYWTLGMTAIHEGRTRQGCRYLERAAYLEPEREAEWWRYCSETRLPPWARER
jgi:4-amino-4-deoxy-L-arabinose transferase-like glycosyltransferase